MELPPEPDPLEAVGLLSGDGPSPPGLPGFPAGASPPESAFVRAFALDERSFFAQPEPLKWTAGGANVLRSVSSAPHAGQNLGPGAAMPWITSVCSPQLEQR